MNPCIECSTCWSSTAGVATSFSTSSHLTSAVCRNSKRTAPKQLVPYITLDGALGLWPIGVSSDDNTWVKSAWAIALEARSRWVAAISNRATGAYRLLPAAGLHPEPVWPLKALPGWLNLAFPAARQICDRDHPVVCKLRGD